MKKRLISCIAALLLLASLLCSCTAGLPLSELALVAREQTGTLATRVENLLANNAPLAANGKSDFAVVFDKAAAPEVQNAVADFCAQFQAYSGADPMQTDPQSAKGRILIGMADTEEAKEILRTLSPSTFYIGFCGKDLLILARNDVMLCEALRYFRESYLTPTASQGEKNDVFFPNKLAYTAPTIPVEDDVYTILRAEESGEGTVDAMSQLCDTLRTMCGVRPVRKSDFNYKTTEHEILFGHPNHPKANAILETLPRDAYYIGVEGKTLMILAQNDLMLQKAVSHFLSLFVTDRNAALDKKNKRIELPATCDYYHQENSILLAENGINQVALVYADDTSAHTRAAIDRLCSIYKQLTNATLAAFPDSHYARVDGVFEILIGRTSRSETQVLYFDGIAKGEWRMAVDENSRALVVGANGEFALRAAVDALRNALIAQTAALSRESIYGDWWIKDGVDRLLYLCPDFAQNGTEVPDLPGNYVFKNNYTMQLSKAKDTHYESYCNTLFEAGFARISATDTEKTRVSVYQTDTRKVTVTYNIKASTLVARIEYFYAR